MATKENTLRKKPVRTESHNPEMEILLSHVSIEKEIPFKQVVTQALTELLANANM